MTSRGQSIKNLRLGAYRANRPLSALDSDTIASVPSQLLLGWWPGTEAEPRTARRERYDCSTGTPSHLQHSPRSDQIRFRVPSTTSGMGRVSRTRRLSIGGAQLNE